MLNTRSIAACVTALAVGVTLAACTQGSTTSASHTPAPSAPRTTVVTPVDTPDPTFDYADTNPTLSLKQRSKECFGDAGCNLTYEVELGVDDPDLVPAGATGSVSFTIKGGEDGPIEDTIDLTGTSYTQPQESVQTPNRNSKVTITLNEVVTD